MKTSFQPIHILGYSHSNIVNEKLCKQKFIRICIRANVEIFHTSDSSFGKEQRSQAALLTEEAPVHLQQSYFTILGIVNNWVDLQHKSVQNQCYEDVNCLQVCYSKIMIYNFILPMFLFFLESYTLGKKVIKFVQVGHRVYVVPF